MLAPANAASVVAFGDSITDGFAGGDDAEFVNKQEIRLKFAPLASLVGPATLYDSAATRRLTGGPARLGRDADTTAAASLYLEWESKP